MTASGNSNACSVLVVDDQPVLVEFAKDNLISAGFSVLEATSGLQAIEKLSQSKPELVLLDILMPKMDGFETLRHMRSLPQGTHVPIVLLTALGDMETHQRALEAGADDLLSKPIHCTELLMRVRSLLRVKRLRDELHKSLELIRSQRDALVYAQKQKEELAALLVHDLKSPLASMLAGTEFLSRDAGLSKEGVHCANDILQAGKALQRMVMSLQDISRSENGALIPQRTELDLGALIKQIEGQATPLAAHRKIAINTEIQGAPRIHADRDLVRRILENLVDNALKSAPKGSAIRLEAFKGDGVADIRICDQGPGIPSSLREKVFEKYVRLDQAASLHVSNGAGLGLAFCRKAVEAHCGWIWVEENQPQGSKFCVRLPA